MCAKEHKAYILENAWDIRGRIYISYQGINAQFSGPKAEAIAYTEWVAEQSAFVGLQWRSYEVSKNMFPKLRCKFKPNLISLQGGMEHLPVVDKEARATTLEPQAWQAMLANATRIRTDGTRHDAAEPAPVVLDVRNSYEWDAGHFEGAERPREEEFRETPCAPDDPDAVPAPLRGVPPDTPVMMYCTGGIRCDVYSTFLRRHGFSNLYSLQGGVQHYLEQVGADSWNGSLYVFDDRMAVAPGHFDGAAAAESEDSVTLPAAQPCAVCGAAPQLPHINCANVDCNLLFLACSACKHRLRGCCCETCRDGAPRLLRPAKDGSASYRSMGQYADDDYKRMLRKPSPERLLHLRERRAKRRLRAQERRAAAKALDAERKAAAKAAMAEADARQAAAAERNSSVSSALAELRMKRAVASATVHEQARAAAR